MAYRLQRVRDPLHGLIEFPAGQFEHALWTAVQTRPFQRLRRVKQLGLSELVYPGATHTRFSHCLGTFHVGRQLMRIIEHHKGTGLEKTKADQVLAAALLHDVGHGPFSHAFEEVGKRMGWKAANHEHWSGVLIREGEIAEALKEMGSGFASDVADIISGQHPRNMYEAVVSSQFDADRLDYMQRDRLMTGTHHGAIDFAWLLANIEVGTVPKGVDDTFVENVDTFVLGAKAVSAAETYVLGLLQLYQTVYFHKTTRGAEKLFTELLVKVCEAVRDGKIATTGLPETHPLVRFANDPENLDVYLALDDAAVWGALPLMSTSSDSVIADLSSRLRDRRLYKCIDVRSLVERDARVAVGDDDVKRAFCVRVFEKLKARVVENPKECHRLLLDRATREPYKKMGPSKGPLNQIRIRSGVGDELVDIVTRSAVVRAIPPIEIWRVYVPQEDSVIREYVEQTVKEVQNEQQQ